MIIVEFDRMTGWEENKTFPYNGDTTDRDAMQKNCEERMKIITNRYHYRVEEDDYELNPRPIVWY